jgi:hydrogenase maturation protease
VGIFIVHHPLLKRLSGVRILATSGGPAELMDFWKGAGTVYLFDAVFSGNTPGRIYRFDPIRNPLSRDLFRLSTHRMSLVDIVELSRILDQLPDELIVFGIEGKNLDPGQGLSQETRKAALAVIRRVSEEIRPANTSQWNVLNRSQPNMDIGCRMHSCRTDFDKSLNLGLTRKSDSRR